MHGWSQGDPGTRPTARFSALLSPPPPPCAASDPSTSAGAVPSAPSAPHPRAPRLTAHPSVSARRPPPQKSFLGPPSPELALPLQSLYSLPCLLFLGSLYHLVLLVPFSLSHTRSLRNTGCQERVPASAASWVRHCVPMRGGPWVKLPSPVLP